MFVNTVVDVGVAGQVKDTGWVNQTVPLNRLTAIFVVDVDSFTAFHFYTNKNYFIKA